MAASVSGAKTVSNAVAPHLSGSTLTTILGTAIENLTVKQLKQIDEALTRVSAGADETKTIGSFLS
jgi:hypothetical protein